MQSFFLNAYKATASIFAPEEVESANEEENGQLSGDRYEGVKDSYVALVRDEDPGVSLSRLRDEIETDDALARSCRPLVHDSGARHTRSTKISARR